MILKDFFEMNSVSLELSELFDELKEEKSKTSALKSALKETLECYEGEEGERIILEMSAYWLALTNGIKSDTYRKKVEEISDDKIKAEWGDDADTVIEVLESLLKEAPRFCEKKKVTPAEKLGSKNWKKGDIFAYKLESELAFEQNLDKAYALIYVVDIQTQTSRRNDVSVNLLMYFDGDLSLDIDQIIDGSVMLPVCNRSNDSANDIIKIIASTHPEIDISKLSTLSSGTIDSSKQPKCDYRYLFFEPHNKYPTEKLIFLGNKPSLPSPQNEIIRNRREYDILYWIDIEKRIMQQYGIWKKYGEKQEKFRKYF